LDLFCGAGGAAVGYSRAGFTEIVGVDIKAQPRYPFTFVLGDALEYVRAHGREFDAIHASPPCQRFTQMSARWRGKGTRADDHEDMLSPTLAMLRGHPRPWVVENVQGAGRLMNVTARLHGGMFKLGVHRPRLFESNVHILVPYVAQTKLPLGVYGTKPDGRTTYRYRNNGNYKGKSLILAAKSIEEASEAMGIDWMTWEEIREAVPPSYTEFIGRQLIAALGATARRSGQKETT
jgi:DNA (cytosine-5)-methyltransferase 1